MHPLFYVPEILIQIVLYLDEEDLATCHNVTHLWRQTLKHNLCPYQKPLPDPDYPSKHPHRTRLPDHIPTAAAHIEKQMNDWAADPILPLLEDHHFFWRESMFDRMLDTIKPCLHPFLASNASEFVEGLEELAEGKMEVTIRTQCLIKDFSKLQNSVEDVVRCPSAHRKASTLQRHESSTALASTSPDTNDHDKAPDLNAWPHRPLSQPFVDKVEVSCLRGGLWDHSNKSVLHRHGLSHGLWSIRVERKKGVRLLDVLDELRGVLLPIEETSTDGTTLLEWRLGWT